MRRLALLMITALLSLNTAWATEGPPDPRGHWVTASGNLEVEVAPCGPALCGTATKVLANRSMRAGGEALQPADTRPALGMKILLDFLPDEDEAGQWQGQIYNRENGKTYRCTMSLNPAGELVLRAYVVLPIFGQTQVWQRVKP